MIPNDQLDRGGWRARFSSRQLLWQTSPHSMILAHQIFRRRDDGVSEAFFTHDD